MEGRSRHGSTITRKWLPVTPTDPQGGAETDGDRVARAREACREEAVDRGYEVRGTSDVRRVGDPVRMTLDLRRRGRTVEGYCRYQNGRADLEIR